MTQQKQKEDNISSNVGEFLVILLSSILFIVNFMFVMPQTIFYAQKLKFEDMFNYSAMDTTIKGIDTLPYFIYNYFFIPLYDPSNEFKIEYTPDNTKITDESLHTNKTEKENIYLGTYFYNGMVINTKKGIKNDPKQIFNTSNKYFGNEFIKVKKDNSSLLFSDTEQFYFDNTFLRDSNDIGNFSEFLAQFCINNSNSDK